MPGPSTGDAAEHIESLGFDPWSFAELEIVSESDHDGIVTTEFSITGLAATLSALRDLFDSARFLGFGMVARDTRKPILDGGQDRSTAGMENRFIEGMSHSRHHATM